MSATIPFLAMAVLMSLSLGASQAARVTASAGRQVATATLACGVLMSFLFFN